MGHKLQGHQATLEQLSSIGVKLVKPIRRGEGFKIAPELHGGCHCATSAGIHPMETTLL